MRSSPEILRPKVKTTLIFIFPDIEFQLISNPAPPEGFDSIMLVCHCRGISDRKIRRAVMNGCASAREVARETGAGMRCGGCRSTVKAIVNEALASERAKTAPGETMLDVAIPVEG